MPSTENERLLSEHQPNAVRARLAGPVKEGWQTNVKNSPKTLSTY